jgi:hypothetical protein
LGAFHHIRLSYFEAAATTLVSVHSSWLPPLVRLGLTAPAKTALQPAGPASAIPLEKDWLLMPPRLAGFRAWLRLIDRRLAPVSSLSIMATDMDL